MTENSTLRPGFREGTGGASPTKARREGAPEPGQEMARRPPPLPGKSAGQARIQVEPRTTSFALSRTGSGRFRFVPERERPRKMLKFDLTDEKMSKKQFLICLGAVLLWIAFIFFHSLQPVDVSTSESTRVLALLRRIVPFELTEHFVRKMSHYAEFCVLGVLLGTLFCGCCQHLRTGFLFAVMAGMSTALCDETIQLFVEGRSGQISDVWIDIAGVVTGAVLVLSIQAIRRRKARRKRHDQDTGIPE